MRKNQKYSKEEMYRAIELWHESGLTQSKFCFREKLSVKTFSYWLRKYRKEKGLLITGSKKTPEIFIPVEVSGRGTLNDANAGISRIEILLPNGVRLSFPSGTDIHQLKTLVNF